MCEFFYIIVKILNSAKFSVPSNTPTCRTLLKANAKKRKVL